MLHESEELSRGIFCTNSGKADIIRIDLCEIKGERGVIMYQLIIKNTRIIDGTGSPAYRADLAVMDGKIAAIAPEIHEEAELVIDGEGLVTAPGFIDIHSHSDTYFLVDDRGESRIYQGVTSELAGQCGSTI